MRGGARASIADVQQGTHGRRWIQIMANLGTHFFSLGALDIDDESPMLFSGWLYSEPTASASYDALPHNFRGMDFWVLVRWMMCYSNDRARSSSAPALASYPARDCSKHMTWSQSCPRLRLEILTCDNGSIALDSVLVPGVFDVDSRIGAPVVGGRRMFRWVSCRLLLEPDATSDMAEPGNPVSMFLAWCTLGGCFRLHAQLQMGGQCYRDSEKFLDRIEIAIMHLLGNVAARGESIAFATWRFFSSAMSRLVSLFKDKRKGYLRRKGRERQRPDSGQMTSNGGEWSRPFFRFFALKHPSASAWRAYVGLIRLYCI